MDVQRLSWCCGVILLFMRTSVEEDLHAPISLIPYPAVGTGCPYGGRRPLGASPHPHRHPGLCG